MTNATNSNFYQEKEQQQNDNQSPRTTTDAKITRSKPLKTHSVGVRGKASCDEGRVGPDTVVVGRGLAEDVARVEVARGPADISEDNCRITQI